jgi:hypothetical protein
MKIFTLFLIAIAVIFIISGCGGGGSTTNPIITDYGTVTVNDTLNTVTFTPSNQVSGLLADGNVYCSLTKNASVINTVLLQRNGANWVLDYSGNSNTPLYAAATNGTYTGEYQVALYVRINNEVKLVTNSYLVNLNFNKSTGTGDGPPPPPPGW